MNGHLPAPAARLRTLVTALLSVVLLGAANAQTITIIDGFAAACGGTLFDSGGDTGAGYGPGEDWTLVLCAESPGQAIRLDWSTFNLANGDAIEVFDGPDNTAASFGQLTSDIGGVTVQSSYENVITNGQGCLTLHFVSGAGSTGSFAANISCFTPCAPPTAGAVIVGSTVPALVCVGEEVSFDGGSSVGAPGFNVVSYEWNFRDGTTNGTGQVVSHAFAEAGEYNVALTVTDDNNCVNTNVVDVRVRVGTIPNFEGLTVSDTVICQGEEVDLVGVVNSPTWTNVPQPFIEGTTFLPDGSGVSYTSNLSVSGFTAGEAIQLTSDIQVCMVLEHSYSGDLEATLTSPDGAMVLLFDQPGANINFGIPVPADDGVPGEGWLYCFSHTGDLGPITTGNTVDVGLGLEGESYEAGNYTSLNGFDPFVGSTLNGTWTLTITDQLFADDGYIFEWYLIINPALYPDLVSFTPIYGPGADSTFWSGPGIVSLDPDADIAVVSPSAVGENEFTYTVTNDFGCTFDTTITITVNPGIPSPLNIIGDDEICIGTLGQLSAPAGFTGYTWSNGFTGQSISVGAGEYTVTVFSGDCSLESEPFTITGVPSPSPEITGPGFSCGGALAGLSTTETFADYQWSNGLTTPTISAGTGSYTVTVTNAEGCSGTSDVFNVIVGSDPQAAYSTDPVSPQGIGTTVDFTDLSQGNGSPIVDWEWNLGLAGATSTSPSPTYTYDTPGEYPITLTVTTADGCESTISGTFVILPEDIIIPNVFTPNGDGNNEFFEIQNGQYFENTLSVFNRWGQEVFETKNYRNGWRATDLPDGTYYYVFTTIKDGKEYTGHVTILR